MRFKPLCFVPLYNRSWHRQNATLTRFFSTLVAWLSQLAFWRRSRAAVPQPPESAAPASARESRSTKIERDEPPAAPEPTPGWFTRLKQRLRLRRKPVAKAALNPGKTTVIEKPSRERLARARDAEEVGGDTPIPRLSWLVWLNTLLRLRRTPTAEASLDADKVAVIEKPSRERFSTTVDTDAAGESSEPAPQSSRLGRLKNLLSLRRKKDVPEETADGRTSILEKPARLATSRGKDAAELSAEEEQPRSNRFKRLLLRLRSKWMWIPATSITLLALVAAVVMGMVQSAHEKEKLKAELQATKKKLQQKAAAPPATVKIVLSLQAEAETPPEKKGDPAFEIVGHAKAETNSGIDTEDCVVKDKNSVVQNLKNCIEGFNNAMASSPEKTRKR